MVGLGPFVRLLTSQFLIFFFNKEFWHKAAGVIYGAAKRLCREPFQQVGKNFEDSGTPLFTVTCVHPGKPLKCLVPETLLEVHVCLGFLSSTFSDIPGLGQVISIHSSPERE